MAYLENEKQEIRNTWFCEHIATIEGEEGLQVINFGKTGTNMYRVKYVLSDNNLFISGDIGEAVYTLTCPATLDNIKRFNLSYLTGKLVAFSGTRWDFNPKLAKKQLNTYWKETNMSDYVDERAIYQGILSAIEESSNFEMYQRWLFTVYNDTSVEYEDLEVVEEFGKEMPMRFIAYWVGLQMAIEQVEKEKEKTA